MGLLKFGLCVVTWVLCASETSADNTGLISSELECVEGQDLPSGEPCTKCICTQGKIICIDVDCDLEKKENATRSGPPRNSLYEKIVPPENIFNGPRHPLVDIINKQPITNGLPHLSSVYTKERNVIKMGKPTPNISMILTETHVENVLKTFLTHNHNDDQYVLIIPEVSQENKYPDKRDTSLADSWEHKYKNKFKGQPSQTVSSKAFKNAPFPTYDSKRPYGVLFNENKQRYSSSIILDDQSSVPLARKPLVFGRPGDESLIMRPRHFMRNEDFAKQQNKNKQFYPYSDSINHNVRSWFDLPTEDEIKSAVKSAAKSAVKSKSQEMLESLARQKGFNFDFNSQFNNPFSSYPLANENIPNINFHTPDQAFPFSQNKYNYPNQPIVDKYNNINGNSAILYDDDQEQMLGNDQYNIDTMPPSANLQKYNNKLFAPNPDYFKQLSSNLPDISYSNKKQPFVPLPAPIQDPIKYQRPENRYPEQFYNKQYTQTNNQPKKQCGKTSAVPCRNQMTTDKTSPHNSKKNTSPLPSSQSYRPLQIFQPWSMNKPIEFSKPLNVSPYIQPKQHNKTNNYRNSNLPQGTPSDQINKDNVKPRLPNATPYRQLQPLVNNNNADYKINNLNPNTLLPSQDPAYGLDHKGLVSSKNPSSNKLQILNDTKPKPSQFWRVTKPNMISNELIPDNAVDNTELAPVPENKPVHKKSYPAKLFNNIPKFFGNMFHKSPPAVAPSYHDDVSSQQNNIPNDKNPEMQPNSLETNSQINIPQAPNNVINDKPNDFAPDKKEHTSNNNEVSLEYSNTPDYQNHQMKPNGQEQFILSNNGQLPYEDTRPNSNNKETKGHSNIPDYGNHKAKPIEQEPSHPNNNAHLPNNMFDDETSNNELTPDKNEDVPVNTNNIVPQEYHNKIPHKGFSVTPNPMQLEKRPNLLPFMPFQMPFNGNNVLFPNKVTNKSNYPDLPINKPANKPKEPKTFKLLNKEPRTYPNNNMPLLYNMPYMPKTPFSYIPPILVDEPKMYPEYNSLPPYYPLTYKKPVNPQIINNAPEIYENVKPVSDHHPNVYKKPINKIPQTFKKPSKTYPKDKPSPFKFNLHKPETPINHWPLMIYDEPEILSDYENIPQDYPLIHEKPNKSPISNPKELDLYPDNKYIPMFNHYQPYQYKEPPQIGNNIPTIHTKPKPKPTFHFYPHKPKMVDNPSPLIFNNEPETNKYENILIPDKEPLTSIKEPNIYPIVKPRPVLNYYQDRPKELTNHRPQIFYDEPQNLPNHKNIPIFNDYPLIPEPEMYPESKPSPTYNFPHTAYEPAVNNPQSYNDEPELYSDDEYIPVLNHYPQEYEKPPQYTKKKNKKPKIAPKPIFNFYPLKKLVNQSPVILNDNPEIYPDYEFIPIPDSYQQTNKYPVSERPQTFDKAPDIYPEVKRPEFQFVPHRPKEPVNKIPQILYDETDILPHNDDPLAFKNPIYNMPPKFKPMPILYPKSPASDNFKMVNKPSEIYPKIENILIDNFYPHKPQEPTNLASPIFYDEPEIYPDNIYKSPELYPNINKKPFNDYPQPFKEAPQYTPKKDKKPKITPKPIFNFYPHKKPVSQGPVILNDKPEMYPDYEFIPIPDSYPQTNKYPVSERPQTFDKAPDIYPEVKRPEFQLVPHRPKEPVNKIPQILYDETDILPDYENIPIFKDYPLTFKNPIYNMPPKFNPRPKLYPKRPVSDNSQMVNKPSEIYPKLENIPIDNFYPHKIQEPANLASPIFYDEPEIYADNSSKPSELYQNINKKPFNDYLQPFKEAPQMQPKGRNIPKFNNYPQKPKEPVYQIPQIFNEIPQNFPDYINVPPYQNYPQMPIKASASPNPYNKLLKLQPTMKPSPLFKYYPYKPIKPVNHTAQTLNLASPIFYDEPEIYPDNIYKSPELYPNINKKPFNDYPQPFKEAPQYTPKKDKKPKITPKPIFNFYPHKKPVSQGPVILNDKPEMYPDYEFIPIPDSYPQTNKYPVSERPQTFDKAPDIYPEVKRPEFQLVPHRPKEPVNKIPQILYDETDILPDYENIPIFKDYPLTFKNPIYNMPPKFNPRPKLYPKRPVSDNSQMVNKPSEINSKLENIPIDNFYPHKPQEPTNLASPIFYDGPETYSDNSNKPDYINVPPYQNYPQMPIKASASPNPYNKLLKLQPTMKPSPLFKYYPYKPIKPVNHTAQTLNDEPQIYPDNNSNPFEPYPDVDKKPTIKYPQTYPKYKQRPIIKPKKPVKLKPVFKGVTPILPISAHPKPYIDAPKLQPKLKQSPKFNFYPHKPELPNIYPDYENIPLPDNISVKSKNPVNNNPQTYYNMPELQPTVKPNPISEYYPHRPKEPTIYTPSILNNKPKNYPDNNIKPSEHIPKIDNKTFYNNPPIFNEIPKIYPEVTKSPMPNYYPYKPKEIIKQTPQTFPYIPDIYPDYEKIPLFANSPVKPKIPMKNRPQGYNNVPLLQPIVKPSPTFKYFPHRPAKPKRPIILNNEPGNLPDYKEKVNPIVTPKPFTNVPDLYSSNEHIPIFNYFPPKQPSQELNKQSQVYPKINPSPIFNKSPQKPKEPDNYFIPEIFNDEEKLYPDYDIIPIFDDNLYPSIDEEPTYANLPILNHAPEIYPKDKHKPITSSYPYIPEYALTKDNPQTYNEAPNMKPKVTGRPIYKGYPHIPNQPVNNSPQNPMPYKVEMPVPTPMALPNNHELLSPEEINEFCRICKMLHCCPTTPLPTSEHPICFDANIDEPHFQYFRPFDSDIHQYFQVPDYSGKGYIPFGWHNPDIQSDVGNDMPYLMTPFYDNLVDVVPITSDLQKRDIIFSNEINGILQIIAELHKTDELYDKELGMTLSPFDYFDASNSIKYHDLPVKSEIPKPKITQSKPDIYELGNNKNDLTDEPTKYNLNKPDGSEIYNQKLESNFDSLIHFDHKGDKDGIDSGKKKLQSTELISKQPQVTGNIIDNTAKESVKPKKQSKSSIDYSDFDYLPTYIDTKVRSSDPIRPKRYLVQRDSSKVVEDNSINVPSVFDSIGKAMKYARQSIKC